MAAAVEPIHRDHVHPRPFGAKCMSDTCAFVHHDDLVIFEHLHEFWRNRTSGRLDDLDALLTDNPHDTFHVDFAENWKQRHIHTERLFCEPAKQRTGKSMKIQNQTLEHSASKTNFSARAALADLVA